MRRFIGWLGIAASKFHDWRARYGSANEHNALVPRDWWLEPWEKAAILQFHAGRPLEGYRRIAFMVLDAHVVAVSPSSVYPVLCEVSLITARRGDPRGAGPQAGCGTPTEKGRPRREPAGGLMATAPLPGP